MVYQCVYPWQYKTLCLLTVCVAVRTHINKILYEDREKRRMQKMQKNAGVH